MNNKEKYVKTFAHLHSDYASVWEVEGMEKKEKKKNFRMRKSFAVVLCILVFMMAMSCIAYAATDGEIVDNVKDTLKILVNGQPQEMSTDENGNVVIQFDENDDIKYEDNNGVTMDIQVDGAKGEVTVDGENAEVNLELKEVEE